VLVRVRGWFDGTGWFIGGAILFFVFALLALLLELQAPESVLWTGTPVAGAERGGIVFFQWAGQQHQFSAPGYGSAKKVIVYFDPSNPDNAMLDSNAALDAHLVTEIVSATALMPRALELAERIAGHPPEAVAALKQLIEAVSGVHDIDITALRQRAEPVILGDAARAGARAFTARRST